MLFHPVFLYESIWNLALCGLLLWAQRRFELAAGRLFGVYLVGYGVGRFWIEGLRIDRSHSVGGLRLNQWVTLAGLLAGSIYLTATRGRKWGEPSSRARTPNHDGGHLSAVETIEGSA